MSGIAKWCRQELRKSENVFIEEFEVDEKLSFEKMWYCWLFKYWANMSSMLIHACWTVPLFNREISGIFIICPIPMKFTSNSISWLNFTYPKVYLQYHTEIPWRYLNLKLSISILTFKVLSDLFENIHLQFCFCKCVKDFDS